MKITFKLLIAFIKNEDMVVSACLAVERLIC